MSATAPTRALARLADLCESGVALDIFSLNYDLCIEKSLTDSGRAFLNGFSADAGWNPDELLSSSAPIRLFKLHGSLDWIEDELYGLCSIEYPVHSHRKDLKTEGSRPLLIFGTVHKLSPREPFLTLAYHFARGTLDAPVLVIIGYSFGDRHVNEIIRQAMKKNRRLRVVVVSPKAKLLINQQDFLARQPRVTPIVAGAKIALNDSEVARRVRELLGEAAWKNRSSLWASPAAHRSRTRRKRPVSSPASRKRAAWRATRRLVPARSRESSCLSVSRNRFRGSMHEVLRFGVANAAMVDFGRRRFRSIRGA